MEQELHPLFDQIVVREMDEPEIRKSGLHLPAGTRATPAPQRGYVVAVGPGMDWWAAAGVEMPVAVGDEVLFPFTAGVYVEVGEEKLLVLRVGMLLGVLREVRPAAVQTWGDVLRSDDGNASS